MPMVPTMFVPGVDQQASQTPRQSGSFVQPMDNRAPSLLQQTGATAEQVGMGLMREGQTIGDRIRDQLNDTAVKNAETQLLTGVQAALRGQNGYMYSRGDAAVNGYDATAQALAKAKQDAEGTLTNDFQRRMFAPVADRHLLTFGSEMSDHRFEQVASVSAKSATDRVEAHIPFAVNARAAWQQANAQGSPAGPFQAHLAVIQQEAAQAAGLMYGVTPDSDIAQAAVRKATTEVARGVVSGFLTDHAYQEAKTFFDDWNSKGRIDERTAEILQTAIKENGDRESVETTATSAALNALSAKGGGTVKPSFMYPVTGGSITQQYGQPEQDGRPHNGVDIAVPVGTQVKAPGSGKVLQVWNDDQNGGGLSMRVQMDNGYVAGFAHLSVANYKPGDPVTQGQVIAQTGNSGTNTTGAHLHYTITGPDGQKVDPANVNQVTPGQKAASLDNFTDPKDLQAAIDNVRSSVADPVLQKQTVNYLESLQRKARVQQEEIGQQNFRTVLDQWYSAGGDAGKVMRQNPEGWAQLTQQQKYTLNKGLPKEDDFDTLKGFILDPSTLTVQNVTDARAKLTDDTVLRLLEKAKSVENRPDVVRGVEMDNEQLNSILLNNGLQRLVDPSEKSEPTDKAESIQLKTAIRDQIDAAQQGGRQLTRQQKADVMNQVIMQRTLPVYAPDGRSWWNSIMVPLPYTDPQKPLAQLTPEEQQKAYVMVGDKQVRLASIPADFRASATARLQRRNVTPTEQAIANLWVQTGQGAR